MGRLAAIALLTAVALAGCSSAAPDAADPERAETATSSADATGQPAEAPSATDADAELDAFRTALQGQSPHDPESLVAAVEAAGFDRSAIERTREVDSLGQPVTFLEIAVRVDGGCLVGQVGDGEPLALRADALGGERCLVGDVVALD